MINEKETPKKIEILKGFITLFAVWVVLVALALWFFEIWPKTLLGWILAISLGPLIFLIFQVVGELAHSVFQKIPFLANLKANAEEQGKGKQISLSRMGYLFIDIVLFVGLGILILSALSSMLGDSTTPIESFFEKHYS